MGEAEMAPRREAPEGPSGSPESNPPHRAELQAMLDAALDIARQAGDLVREGYLEAHTERQKGHSHNLVTETDIASEKLIVAELARRFPSHSIRAEEGGGSTGREGDAADGEEIAWYVDPLDGTNNFAHGYPVFSVSLAAMRGNAVLVGVTYDPTRDEVFTAIAGEGAMLNGTGIEVSERSSLDASLVATGFPYDKQKNPDNNLAQFAQVVPNVRGIRRSGSAALDLAYVAAGRLDAYWERGTAAWDVAAGVLMVLEAGGRVTDYEGGAAVVDGGRFVASNGRIHEALLERLSSARARVPEAEGLGSDLLAGR